MKLPFTFKRNTTIDDKAPATVDAGDALDRQFPAHINPVNYAVPSATDQWLLWSNRIREIEVLDEGCANLLTPEIEAEGRLYVDQILARGSTLRTLHTNQVAESTARLEEARADHEQADADLARLKLQDETYSRALGAVTAEGQQPGTGTGKYDPQEDLAAGTGRTVRAEGIRRVSVWLIGVGVALDAILGHVAFDRLLEEHAFYSWFAAIGIALFCALLAHWAGQMEGRGGRRGALAAAAAWFTTVLGLAVVRYHVSGASVSSSGSLSSADSASATTAVVAAQWPGAVLMIIVFLVTASIAFITGAHVSSVVSARRRVAAELPEAEARVRKSRARHERAQGLHDGHLANLNDVARNTAHAIKAQLDTSEWIVARAALALREKLGNPEADFTQQLELKQALNPDATRLLAILEEAPARSSDG